MTKSEKQVMELLWKADIPLSCSEIISQSPDKTWKDSYVHSLVKSLLNKGYIEIAFMEKVSKSYSRKFSPAITKDEYHLKIILGDPIDRMNFLHVVKLYCDRLATIVELSQIEVLAKSKKQEKIQGQ